MPGRRQLLAGLLSACVFLLALGAPAAAHEPDTSVVDISSIEGGVEVLIEAPVDELGVALDQELPTDVFGISLTRDILVEYILANFQITGETGDEPWPLKVGRLTVIEIDGIDFLRVVVEAEGQTTGTLTVHNQMILEANDTHQIIVSITDEDGTQIAGLIDPDSGELTLNLAADGTVDSSAGSSFIETMKYGFDHVLDGADHVLFLLTLLLPAPLLAVDRRWQTSPGGLWQAWKKVVHVATAFTVGHSISLAASTLDLISLPARPVEILIALSVGVSALHALRPITTRGEVPIAGGFGLVHGLAFAEILSNTGISETSTLRTLISFNVGVELAQLAAIACVFPSLWLLSRSRAYPIVRIAGAGLALALSVAWIVDRLDIVENPFASFEAGVINRLVSLAALFSAAALLLYAADRQQRSSNDIAARTHNLDTITKK